MATPELLREAVERAIMTYDPIRTSETQIDVAVEPDGITLSGYVRTDTMRSVASQLARAVPGVRSVRNNLYSDSDLEIMASQAIELRLGTLVVPMMPVVRAIRGHLFLRGPVPSESAKQLIEEAARMVPGVAMVHNLLDVDPDALERLIAPKKAAVAARAGGAGGGQAMVGGKPVTEADLPAWAMKPKTQWGMADYKARAKAKLLFKRSEGPDPKEMEEAGAILRGGGDEAEAEPEAVPEVAPVAEAAAPVVEEVADEAPAAPVDLAALRAQFPAWALKPKEEWDADDFKGQMAAKRAAKTGGEAPEALIERAQAALKAALHAAWEALPLVGGDDAPAAPAAPAGPRPITPELLERYPAWALKAKDQWDGDDFKANAKAKSAFKKGAGPDPDALIAEAQAALG